MRRWQGHKTEGRGYTAISGRFNIQLISVDNGLHYGMLSNEIKMIEKKQKELFPHSICNLCGFYCHIDAEINNIYEKYNLGHIDRDNNLSTNELFDLD